MHWPWNPGQGSFRVIENYTIRSGTHDFLLTFRSNHRPISHRFRDKWRFLSKIANFPHPVYFAPPLKGLPLELDICAGSEKKQNDGATRWAKKFYGRFSRLDKIPACDRRTDWQTRYRRKDRAMLCVARVKICNLIHFRYYLFSVYQSRS